VAEHEIRAVCPECSSITRTGRVEAQFYYNPEKGVGHCFHCGFKGKFQPEEIMEVLDVVSDRIKPVFDFSCVSKLQPLNDISLRYLRKRFPEVTDEQLNSFDLAYSPERHAIAIPNYRSGKLIGVKYRGIDAKSYTSEAGSQSGGYWLTAPSRDKLLIVEGELDAVAGRLLGFEGSILALQTNKISQEALQESNNYRHVFLALDNDEPGRDGLNELSRILTHSVPVTYPEGVKDLNELLQTKGHTEASEYLRLQTLTAVEKATVGLHESLDELVTYLSNTRNTRGDSTGWKAIDELLGGGLRPQEMTVVHSFAKVGKTSFILNLIHNLAKLDKKIAIASFEMSPATQLYPSLLSIAGQFNIRELNDKDKLLDCIQVLKTGCAYLNNITAFKQFGDSAWSDIAEWATLMRARGAEYLVLDHAGFCVTKMTDAEENQILAKNIKKLTLSLGMHILVVVQAPKSKDGLSLQSAYGGMAWSMNADNFIILERSKDDENELRVRLEAARYPGARPSYTPALLFYNRETCTLMQNLNDQD
jgi:5S rRNA maturation endonuclease (ribonuclease M5)